VPIASGANSVASALGNRTRRDPGTAMRTYYEGLKPTRKTGTFYFGGNRNFLLWSDSTYAICVDGTNTVRGPASGGRQHQKFQEFPQNLKDR
jgi:hypothetical protein